MTAIFDRFRAALQADGHFSSRSRYFAISVWRRRSALRLTAWISVAA